MLAAMTSKALARWEAFYMAENEVTPEAEEAAQMEAMDLSEQAKTNLAKRLGKRRKDGQTCKSGCPERGRYQRTKERSE